MTAKTYSSPANARRAARQSGLMDSEYDVFETDNNRWGICPAPTPEQEEPMNENPFTTPEEDAERVAAHERGEDEYVPLDEEEVLDLTTVNTLAANRATSTVKKPVRYVHDRCAELVAENPSIRRKDLVAALVAEGIAYYTARTQVQVWKKAHPNGVVPAALQPEAEEVADPDVLNFDGGALIDAGVVHQFLDQLEEEGRDGLVG